MLDIKNFNWFVISCFVSFGFGCLVPAFHSAYGVLILLTAVAYVYFRQRLIIFSEKLKLSFPAYVGDFILFVAPQILVILFLNALHYFAPGTTLNALQIALSSAFPYFFVFVLCSLNTRCKPHLVENIFGLRRAAQLLLGVRSPSRSLTSCRLRLRFPTALFGCQDCFWDFLRLRFRVSCTDFAKNSIFNLNSRLFHLLERQKTCV